MSLWAEVIDGPGPIPVLLIADADTSGVTWPDTFLTALAQRHPVIRYDHRDTGRSVAGSEVHGAPGYGGIMRLDGVRLRAVAAAPGLGERFPALTAVLASFADASLDGRPAAPDDIPDVSLPDAALPGVPGGVDDDRRPVDDRWAEDDHWAEDDRWAEDDGESADDDGEVDDYGVADLAADAVAVLDAVGAPRAHVVGVGMGGLIAQLLLLDHPDRLASATLIATGPLPGHAGTAPPGPAAAVTRLWAELDDPRDDEGELAWRLAEHRLMHGDTLPFDAAAFQALHERVLAHTGTVEPAIRHRRLGPAPARGAELPGVAVPVLVIEAPRDPVHPPPNAAVLAALLHAPLVTVPGLGRVVPDAAAGRLAAEILAHTTQVR